MQLLAEELIVDSNVNSQFMPAMVANNSSSKSSTSQNQSGGPNTGFSGHNNGPSGGYTGSSERYRSFNNRVMEGLIKGIDILIPDSNFLISFLTQLLVSLEFLVHLHHSTLEVLLLSKFLANCVKHLAILLHFITPNKWIGRDTKYGADQSYHLLLFFQG